MGFWSWLAPILLGFGSQWVAGKCRGRNAQKAFRFAAWGFWLLLLAFVPLGFLGLPFFLLNFTLVKLIPSILLFIAAGNSLLKEMRAQKEGEFTDAAV